MCSTSPQALSLGFTYGLNVPNTGPLLPSQLGSGRAIPRGLTIMDIQRAQLFDYTARLQYAASLRGFHPSSAFHHPYQPDPFAFLYGKQDPRGRFVHEEPKPSHSYIGLIAMAILSSPERKLVLSDIYQWILDNYPYFRNRGPGWRNSIRHNLSLNDCFVKSGRSANGKGHYWAIHPANVNDFKKGDFRRRRAQRRVRKHMGLAVPDEDDSPSPSPSPSIQEWQERQLSADLGDDHSDSTTVSSLSSSSDRSFNNSVPIKKRAFDMDTLLARDSERTCAREQKVMRVESVLDVSVSPTVLVSNTSPTLDSPCKRPVDGFRRSAFHVTGHKICNVKPSDQLSQNALLSPKPGYLEASRQFCASLTSPNIK